MVADQRKRIDPGEFLAGGNPFNPPLFIEIREAILAAAPQMDEQIKWGMPVYSCNGKNLCSIAMHRDHYNVEFFIGRHLNDPKRLLQGTGKTMRHIKVDGKSENAAAFAKELPPQ